VKKHKFSAVPVVEDTFALNLAKLNAAFIATGNGLLTVHWPGVAGLVLLEPTRMILMLGKTVHTADVVTVPCLNGRLRPLLKCPRAHEGNFQSLYFRAGELACRVCHQLRYRTTLASSPAERIRLARYKIFAAMGGVPGTLIPERKPYAWRKRHQRLIGKFARLSTAHYAAVRVWLDKKGRET
jgi:hypothetical protein